jgi:DNA-binding NarL/FixJ family response regulator
MPDRGTSSSSPLRVLIVDQHEVSRAAIRALLQTEGLAVVADVSTGEEAFALAERAVPDIAIVDLGPGVRQVLEVARTLAQLPSLSTVVLTSSVPIDGSLDGFPFVAKPDICARELRTAMGSHDTDLGGPQCR